jgi:hypothetical protein
MLNPNLVLVCAPGYIADPAGYLDISPQYIPAKNLESQAVRVGEFSNYDQIPGIFVWQEGQVPLGLRRFSVT